MFLTNKDFYSSPLDSFGEVKTVSHSKITQSQRETPDFNPLILIVEDDADTRLMLKYLLEIWNYRVIAAVSGEEALKMTAIHKPDVILMDYKLPNMNGLMATERIRQSPTTAEPVIIFLSAFADGEIRDSAIAAGASEYLIKPINFGELELALEKHLKINKVNQTQTLRRAI